MIDPLPPKQKVWLTAQEGVRRQPTRQAEVKGMGLSQPHPLTPLRHAQQPILGCQFEFFEPLQPPRVRKTVALLSLDCIINLAVSG
jgi:hypothetical protein